MLSEVRAAHITQRVWEGPDPLLDARDILRLAWEGGARIAGLEGQVGRLEPGLPGRRGRARPECHARGLHLAAPSLTTTCWWPAPGAGTYGEVRGGRADARAATAGRCTSTWTRSAAEVAESARRGGAGGRPRPRRAAAAAAALDAALPAGVLKEGSHVREAQIDETTEGRLPAGEGWFILNLGRDAVGDGPRLRCVARPQLGQRMSCDEPDIGIPHPCSCSPARPTATTTPKPPRKGSSCSAASVWRVVEGQERRMRQWDYLHSPPGHGSHHRSEPATDRA